VRLLLQNVKGLTFGTHCISIDCCTAGDQQQQRRANAGSATLSAYAGSYTQTRSRSVFLATK